MRKGKFLCGVALCAALLCGHASAAVPDEPTPGDADQAKIRVLTPYLRTLGAAWRSVKEKSADNAAGYDSKALAAAKAERDRQIALCKSRAPDFKTQVAYIDCWTAAARTFASAIKLTEAGLVEGYASALSEAAHDADSGVLTAEQAREAYAVLGAINDLLLGAQLDAYDGETEKRGATAYSQRFLKAYRQGITVAPGAATQPFMDENAIQPAEEILKKAVQACYDHKDFPDRKSYIACTIAADRQFLAAAKLQDQTFYSSYQAQLEAAAAAADAGEMTPYQFRMVETALIEGFNESFTQLQNSNRALLAAPLAKGYTIRFFAAYFAAADNFDDPQGPPYDPAAVARATSDQAAAAAACRKRKDPGATSSARLECFVTAYRQFAQAIKLSDTHLLESFIAAMRRIAADADAGRLQTWQESAAYDGMQRFYRDLYTRSHQTWLAKVYKPLARQYVMRFDNDYIAAGGVDEDNTGPPWDKSLVADASIIRNRSVDACFSRRDELKTRRAFWECRVAAERVLIAAIHLRNTLLFEKMQAVLIQAAIDADDGKITDDQLSAVTTALSRGYDKVRRDSEKRWEAAARPTP